MRTLWLKKSLLQFFITSALLLSLSAYGWFLGDLLKNGYDLSLQFLFQNPADAGRTGGIFSILSSTLILIGLSLLFVIPFGLGTALYLHTHPTPTIITSLNLLAATPSIIFGLFGNAFFVYQLHMGYSLLAGALTLTIMVLPLFVHTSLEALKNVPSSYVEAGVSCGLSPFSVLTQVTLRCATPGILMALALSLGRALSETAALLFTSGYSDKLPSSVFDSGRSLSVHIFDLAMNVPGGSPQAYRSAFVLLLLLILIHKAFQSLAKKMGGTL